MAGHRRRLAADRRIQTSNVRAAPGRRAHPRCRERHRARRVRSSCDNYPGWMPGSRCARPHAVGAPMSCGRRRPARCRSGRAPLPPRTPTGSSSTSPIPTRRCARWCVSSNRWVTRCSRPDQGSLTIHLPGVRSDLVDRVRRLRRDVGYRNGRLARALPDRFAAAGLRDVTVEAFPLVLTDVDDAFGLPTWVEYWREHFTDEDATQWAEGVERARTHGQFVYVLLYFVVAGPRCNPRGCCRRRTRSGSPGGVEALTDKPLVRRRARATSTRTGARRTTWPSGRSTCMANPLLRNRFAPEHIKPRLLGHWGTTPGPEHPLHAPEPADRGDELDMIS